MICWIFDGNMDKHKATPKVNILEISDEIRDIISRFFRVDIIRFGELSDFFLVRYEGHLYSEDSEKVYDDLSHALENYKITPLFRIEENRQVIYLIPAIEKKKKSNPAVNLILFFLTILSVTYTGVLLSAEEMPAEWNLSTLWHLFELGFPFTISMLGILTAHELGHYFAGRIHKVHVTLPYFIPFPGSPFGTMGAFINMKEIPRNKKQLLDIGLAGPVAGLLVAIPVLYYGLTLSTVLPLPASGDPANPTFMMEGNSLLYLGLKYLAFDQILPSPMDYSGIQPLLYWIRYFFTGTPFPYGGMDVQISAIAWAGWAGLLVTSLNLIPVGQLDGGHLFYVLFGKKGAQKVYPWILSILVALGFVWNGWWFWALLLYLFGRFHAEPLDQITPLDPFRKKLAWLGIILFFLCFMPVPLVLA
jgi:membrane-associated protease RseP (regulator of RpoE activity)